jgi:DNA-binding CsgD family transcriptional regulator
VPLRRIRDRFGLTPAEYRLLCRLVEGQPLREAANTLSVSYETARSTLKSVFSKTGAHRQSELILSALNLSANRPLRTGRTDHDTAY